jgi:Cu(I)/Ag(I) efflux system membrane protein CusA/SilA
MTGMTALTGLTPILWNTGSGADVMKRIAALMVGELSQHCLWCLLLIQQYIRIGRAGK